MKAATARRYGPPDVLRVEDLPTPTPKDTEVLVRVAASSVTSGDVRLRGFRDAGVFWLPMRLMFGLLRPRNPVPGMEFAGRIDAVGARVTRFRVGGRVFGMALQGANAAYLVMPEDGVIAITPAALTDTQAAAIPFGALSAWLFLRDLGRLKAGQRVLVHGASGNVGVFAIQLAKDAGAEVTGVCSTANLAMVRALGADHVIDYTTTDFAGSGATYDIIFDTVGSTSFAASRRALTVDGRHLFLSFGLKQMAQMAWTALRGGQRVICGMPATSAAALSYIKDLVEAGRIRPVIERIYRLEEIAAAHRHVDTGRKKGSVVIAIDGNGACG